MAQRQVVLDTETTGLHVREGDRVIEIGCVELVDRKVGGIYQQYLNPEREVAEGAVNIHGLRTEDLQNQPLFKDCMEEFLKFIDGAQLIMHNASFDTEFIDRELHLAGHGKRLAEHCVSIIDTLEMARARHPGVSNTLGRLCERYQVDAQQRSLHGALLDAQLLTQVYLKMSGGQGGLGLGQEEAGRPGSGAAESLRRRSSSAVPLRVLRADDAEQAAHTTYLRAIEEAAKEHRCLWLEQEQAAQQGT